MLRRLQNAVNEAASAASDGRITDLRLETPPRGKGDVAICIAPLAKALGQSPQIAWKSLSDASNGLGPQQVVSASVAGPFVNLRLDIDALFRAASKAISDPDIAVKDPERIMVEYLSPNTNKPLHLGHVRNGVLGSALANLLSAIGHTVIRAELINDRGEHICKSMLGYMRYGKGMTPESTGLKGDHLVGDMYVRYSRDDKERRDALQAQSVAEATRWSPKGSRVHELLKIWQDEKDKKKVQTALNELIGLVPPEERTSSQLIKEWAAPDPEIVALLEKWEAGDPEVMELWRTMNGWVYDGFAVTKPRFGFLFDKVYFESELYTLGKDQVLEGLERGVFVTDKTGAVFFDLPVDQYGTNPNGTPHRRKVLNANGTTIYLTQDIATAILKAREFDLDRSIYVTANEQDPHFMTLFGILRALGYSWADRCYHMSYAMVGLKDGKMKSREGTVVDADDLADEMAALAAAIIRAREPSLDESEILRRAEVISISAIKFYLARYSPTSLITFLPESSLSFEGDTGPYCLYTYARAQSILAKAQGAGIGIAGDQPFALLGNDDERACLLDVLNFPEGVRKAAESYAPSILIDRMLRLAGMFNRFYKNNQVMCEDVQLSKERLALVKLTAEALRWGFSFFGIVPLEKM